MKGVAGRVDVHDNGHAWIDLQTMDGDLHRVRSTQVVAATLSPAEVARCGKTLSPEKWLEKRIDGELKVTVAGGRVVGNSFVDGAGAPRRQFVVAGDRGGLVRCALCDWTAAPRLCVKIADLRTDKEAWRKLMHAIKSHAGFFPSTREGNTHVAALQRALATVAPAPPPALAAATPAPEETAAPAPAPAAPKRARPSPAQRLAPCRPGAQGPKSPFGPPTGPRRAKKRARTEEQLLFRKDDLVEAREHPDAPLAWATVVKDIRVGATSGRVKWHNSAYPDVTLPIAQISPAPVGRRSSR